MIDRPLKYLLCCARHLVKGFAQSKLNKIFLASSRFSNLNTNDMYTYTTKILYIFIYIILVCELFKSKDSLKAVWIKFSFTNKGEWIIKTVFPCFLNVAQTLGSGHIYMEMRQLKTAVTVQTCRLALFSDFVEKKNIL